MTMWAERKGQDITIHANCNIQMYIDGSYLKDLSITENVTHLRHFWGQLGHLIEEAEQELKAQLVAQEVTEAVMEELLEDRVVVELTTAEVFPNAEVIGEEGPELVQLTPGEAIYEQDGIEE